MNGGRIEIKIDPENAMILGPNGCHYDDEESLMRSHVLDLCGCGDPENVFQLLVESAKAFARIEDIEREWPINKIAKLVKKYPDIAAEFIAHFLDSKEILNHGSSVGGAWLTELGEQFIEIGEKEFQ